MEKWKCKEGRGGGGVPAPNQLRKPRGTDSDSSNPSHRCSAPPQPRERDRYAGGGKQGMETTTATAD